MVKLHTNLGTLTLKLYPEQAPKTVANFLEYVKAGHYDNTIFHRIIDGFMIQGGGFEPGMREKPTRAPIPNEAENGLKNLVYSVAMARTSEPHSATSQFFINVADNDFLNFSAPNARGYGYCVFGKVVQGTELLDEMRKVGTGRRGGHENVPVDDIVIERAEVVEP